MAADDLDSAWAAVFDALPAGWRSIAAVAVLSALAVVGVAGCIPRHPPDLATGECVEVAFGYAWNEVTVVPCALLGREHVYTVAAVRLPDGLTDETDDCPLGVGYELFSTNARIEGAVMPGPLRRFCLFE